MSVDLIEKIRKVNARSEQINRESLEAKAKRGVLLSQISESVERFSKEYGVEFPPIENEEEFASFVKSLVEEKEEELTKQVELAEQVNSFIDSGQLDKAKELLGYQPTTSGGSPLSDEVVEDSPLKEEKGTPAEEPTKSDITTDDLDDLLGDLTPVEPKGNPVTDEHKEEVTLEDDLEELPEEPVSRPRRVRRSSVPTSDFEMDGVSLDELEDVAGVSKGSPKPVPEVDQVPPTDEEEEQPAVGRRRRRRRPLAVDTDSEDVAPASPIKSGGSFAWD